MHGCRLTYALGCALMLVMVGAAPAWAGTVVVARSGGTVTATSVTPGSRDEVRMTLRGGSVFFIGGAFGTATDVNAGAGCVNGPTANDASCPGVTALVLRPGDADDTFTTRTFEPGDSEALGAAVDADMGPGDDALFVGEVAQPVLARGGTGSDGLFGGGGADRLEGGAGNDALGGGAGDDQFLGGADFDTAFYTDHAADVNVSLDGVRNDGDPAVGERDLLDAMEGIFAGNGDDILTGDDGLNDLTGGTGSDRIDGRGGFDRIFGQDGNDTIAARDGLADTVDCSTGDDILVADDIDIAFACERADRLPDLQPDRDGDGIDKPLDCNDLDGTTRPGAFDRPGDGIDQDCDGADDVDRDRDRDGFLAGFDCDDGNAAVHPGAREKLGNKVDEDCDRVADPFAAFPTTVLLSARITSVSELVGLVLVDLDGRERVLVSCKGAGCPRKPRRARAGKRAESLILDRLVRGARLQPGARLTVRITRRDRVRKIVTFTMRAGKSPKQRTRCRAPRGGRVARC